MKITKNALESVMVLKLILKLLELVEKINFPHLIKQNFGHYRHFHNQKEEKLKSTNLILDERRYLNQVLHFRPKMWC